MKSKTKMIIGFAVVAILATSATTVSAVIGSTMNEATSIKNEPSTEQTRNYSEEAVKTLLPEYSAEENKKEKERIEQQAIEDSKKNQSADIPPTEDSKKKIEEERKKLEEEALKNHEPFVGKDLPPDEESLKKMQEDKDRVKQEILKMLQQIDESTGSTSILIDDGQ